MTAECQGETLCPGSLHRTELRLLRVWDFLQDARGRAGERKKRTGSRTWWGGESEREEREVWLTTPQGDAN